MIADSISPDIMNALEIPYITADEAHLLLTAELDRFLRLLGQLGPDDWNKPTACTAWNVRDILAHQAGGYASGTGYREVIRQSSRIRPGRLPEDCINDFQLLERAGKTPQELMAELRYKAPIAAKNWAYHFQFLKLFGMPHSISGILTFRYLMWVIHSRDTWMHRLDICRATGKIFEQTSDHDGRIAALVVRDAAEVLQRKFNGPALLLDLTGIAGGVWKIGHGSPAACIRMDVLDFNIFVSGRYSYEQARPLATITGDVNAAEKALHNLLVLY